MRNQFGQNRSNSHSSLFSQSMIRLRTINNNSESQPRLGDNKIEDETGQYNLNGWDSCSANGTPKEIADALKSETNPKDLKTPESDFIPISLEKRLSKIENLLKNNMAFQQQQQQI